MAITKERENELVYINRVLATLVVVLSLIVGYMLAEKENMLKRSTTNQNSIQIQDNHFKFTI